jgi:lysophospholipase L1-like esterase
LSSDGRAPGRPIRVVVLGSSHTVLVRPRPEPGQPGGTYAARLVDELHERGVAAEVVNEGRWFEMVDHISHRWERDVAPRLPDVVVVHVGFVECQPWVVPHRVHRWALAWDTSLHPLARAARTATAAPVVRLLGWWTPRWVRLTGGRTWKCSSARFRAELERLIARTREELGAEVLVVGMAPKPTGWLLELMPDLDDRMARYGALLADVVRARGDDGVRLVDVGPIHDRLGAGAAPDGIHLSAAAHRDLAQQLAEAIAPAGETP